MYNVAGEVVTVRTWALSVTIITLIIMLNAPNLQAFEYPLMVWSSRCLPFRTCTWTLVRTQNGIVEVVVVVVVASRTRGNYIRIICPVNNQRLSIYVLRVIAPVVLRSVYSYIRNVVSTAKSISTSRGGSTLGQGALAAAQIHLLPPPPDSKASWPFWRDFWGPKMFQSPDFPGLRPGPRWRSLQRSPRPPNWWGGCSLPLSRPGAAPQF